MIAFLRRLNLLTLPLIAAALLFCGMLAILEFSHVREVWPLLAVGLTVLKTAGWVAFYWIMGNNLGSEICQPMGRVWGCAGIAAATIILFFLGKASGFPAELFLPASVLGIAAALSAAAALSLLCGAIAAGLATLFLPSGVDTILAAADRWDAAG